MGIFVRIDRMLAITVMLLNRDRISAKGLSDKFEVNIRTIYRDIESLNLAGIPVVSYQGNNGGFGIVDNYKMDKQLLSLKDISAILTALKGINTTLGDTGIDIAIEKIENLVPDNKKDQINQIAVIDMLPWGVSDSIKSKIKQLHEACSKNRIVNFKYTSPQSIVTERIVEPMTLVLKGAAWYLFAFCITRSDYRIFKITRMKNIEVTGTPFSRRAVSYKKYFEGEKVHENATVELTLKFNKQSTAFVEEYFDLSCITYLNDGQLLVNIKVPDNNWITSWLLGLGDCVEVISPVKYRTLLQEKAKNILNIYSL